jgi:beta-aspartyl-peptidase (threonine type)
MNGRAQEPAHRWAIVLHGGAGVIERATMDATTEAAYRASLIEALGAGAKVLDQGGTSIDAIEAAIKILEDNPLFNAGKGAVFTAEGKNELDAAIMDGSTLQAGLEQADPSYFFTERRWQSLVKQLQEEGLPIPPRPAGVPPAPAKPVAQLEPPEAHKFGTVGVVALDRHGNIAAGTSTGGTQAKKWGRVGDSPIIGAGTYASNQSCAVSATGTGE